MCFGAMCLYHLSCVPSAHQVRYDRSVGTNTSLKFMTDGILLRELQLDFLLHAYSAIVVDEAHERALNTDLLLGGCFAGRLPQGVADGTVASLAMGPQPDARPLCGVRSRCCLNGNNALLKGRLPCGITLWASGVGCVHCTFYG